MIQSGLRRAVAASSAQAGDGDWIINSRFQEYSAPYPSAKCLFIKVVHHSHNALFHDWHIEIEYQAQLQARKS